MAGHTYAQVIGNLGRDPETRHTTGGKTVVSCSVAVSDGTKEREHTSWIDVTAWEKTGEILAEMHKGQTVCIVGRLAEEQWEGKEGERRSRVGVVASLVYAIARAERAPQHDETDRQQPAQGQTRTEQAGADNGGSDGALPF